MDDSLNYEDVYKVAMDMLQDQLSKNEMATIIAETAILEWGAKGTKEEIAKKIYKVVEKAAMDREK